MRRVAEWPRAVRGAESKDHEGQEGLGEERKARQTTMMRKGAYCLLSHPLLLLHLPPVGVGVPRRLVHQQEGEHNPRLGDVGCLLGSSRVVVGAATHRAGGGGGLRGGGR